MGEGPTAWAVPTLRAALGETCLAIADLADTFEAADWSTPTGCPGWDVHDQVAHVTGVEASFVGVTPPEDDFTPGPHVRSDLGLHMERMVEARRALAPAVLIAELRATVAARQTALLAVGDDPQATVPGVFGMGPLATGLRMRVLDCVAHEQDVRRALGRPGHLDTDPGAITRDNTALGFAQAFRRLAEGQAVGLQIDDWHYLLDLTGERARLATAHQTLAAEPALRLTMTLPTAIALGCGRSDADPSAVVVSGDPELGQRLIAAMGFTP